MKINSLPSSGLDGITLRSLHRNDCDAWYAYLSLPEVFEGTSWNLQSVDDLSQILETYLNEGPTSPIRMAVVEQSTEKLVGTIGLHTISEVNRSAEIAYDFAPTHWGRGLASKVCEAVTTWSFDEHNLHRIQATVLVGNQRSERVLARCGFQHEGLLRGYRMVRGSPGDFNIFSRLSTDKPDAGPGQGRDTA
jgi:ribosomal-protein-alanine N-acetyltransferase